MQRTASAASGRSPAEVRTAIEAFLQSSKQPILIEPGEPEIPLIHGQFTLELHGERLSLTAWSDRARVTRRVAGVRGEHSGRLELATVLFGNKPGKLTLVDAARPQHRHVRQHGEALIFRERFRRFLSRQFLGWRIDSLSTEPDLEHTLSPRYPRAAVRRGLECYAAIGSEADDADDVLTFGLIWLDYLRKRTPDGKVAGLILLLPSGAETATRERLAWMDRARADYRLFVCQADGYESEVDLADRGNLDSELPDIAGVAAEDFGGAPWVRELSALAGVSTTILKPGERSLHVEGLEFARQRGDTVTYGLETKTPANASHLAEIAELAKQLARRRCAGGDRQHPLYQRAPERWMEARIRREIERVDATLMAEPIYGQVPAFAGQERGLLDLLAVDRHGRLAVIEVKSAADPHLPMQALDYWMRVQWHWRRGHFRERGYFPGMAMSAASPRLLLVAPALQFHPSTETILGFWRSDIPVERYGLASHWRRELSVVFRSTGNEHPI